MKDALTAEFRKLLTVRSTYFITGLMTLLVILVGFYAQGWRLMGADLQNPNQISSVLLGISAVKVFGAIVGILLMTHEYRYNTILHTLTSSNSRSKVLWSKFIVVSVYAILLSVFTGVLAPLMVYLGVHAHGHVLAPQIIDYGTIVWRNLFYGWGFAMAGLLLAALMRNQIAAIVALFLIPGIVEQLVGALLLKHNSVYLPFSALGQVLSGPSNGAPTSSAMSAGKAALVYCAYVIVGWIIAWILFLKRDAN